MYDCLTAQEESKLFLAAMDLFEKSIDCFDEQHQGLPPHVYTENEVKNNSHNGATPDQPIFFIAGRGGETNFHAGNAIFRDRVLQYTQAYVQAGTRGRGKKFARALMREPRNICANVIFVVRQGYFRKNVEAGKISAARKNSVLAKHAPRTLDDLLHEEESSSHYLAIGNDWVVGIITDLLRTSASKFMASSSSPPPPPQRPQQHAAAFMMPMPTQQQQQVLLAPAPMSSMTAKRKRTPPCPEISIPGDGSAVPYSSMPPYYPLYQQQQPQPQHQHQRQQHQDELFQHHDDCSLSSVSDNDDDDHSMHSRRASVSSASNDMFLSASYPPAQQPVMQQQPPPPPMMMPQPLQKRARMTVTTTTIPVASIPQQWYPSLVAAPPAATFGQQPPLQPWHDHVVTPPIAIHNAGYEQPHQQQHHQQPIPQAYGAAYDDDDNAAATAPWNTAEI